MSDQNTKQPQPVPSEAQQQQQQSTQSAQPEQPQITNEQQQRQQQSAQQAPPQQAQEPKVQLKCGYIVGVDVKGRMIFENVGTMQTLMELLGLHKYAELKLKGILEANEGYGFPFLKYQNEQTSQVLNVLLNMMSKQAQEKLTKE